MKCFIYLQNTCCRPQISTASPKFSQPGINKINLILSYYYAAIPRAAALKWLSVVKKQYCDRQTLQSNTFLIRSKEEK